MTYHHNTAADAESSRIANSAPVSERDMLRDVLTPEEIDLLGRYVGNNATQTVLASQDDVAQTTISYRVRQAIVKLEAAGLPTPKLPGRGRRPMVRDVAIDPLAIGCLARTGAEDGAGRPRMKWRKAKKIDSDGTDHQW